MTCYKPLHVYNTHLKNLSNLNCIKVNKKFGEFNTTNIGIDLCRKLNIDITRFKTKSTLIKYLYSLDLNNFVFS